MSMRSVAGMWLVAVDVIAAACSVPDPEGFGGDAFTAALEESEAAVSHLAEFDPARHTGHC